MQLCQTCLAFHNLAILNQHKRWQTRDVERVGKLSVLINIDLDNRRMTLAGSLFHLVEYTTLFSTRPAPISVKVNQHNSRCVFNDCRKSSPAPSVISAGVGAVLKDVWSIDGLNRTPAS